MTRPLRIALGDLSYINEGNAHNLYVPINIGYIAAHLDALYGSEVKIDLYKDPHRMLDESHEREWDLVGLSLYYWNTELDRAVVRGLHRRMAHKPTIVLGGPCVDTDPQASANLLSQFPGVRCLIPNEGEAAMAAIAGYMLSGSGVWPTIGAGLSTDLATVPSPYLGGWLDPFLDGLHYQPMIQTSRLCPYTCSFCVSGKNRGKLRAFPLEQVREEIEYIGRRFADRPDHILYVTDENFGILQRDTEVARMLVDARAAHGYPRRIFYYNDKRFTQLSRDLHEIVGDMCHHGVMLSLQSENPETLKAIKRRNLTDEQIKDAIAWAHGLGLKVSTELIFGLPMETRESFLGLLDKCARLGFDAIQCYNLILFPGIEMDRAGYRAEHKVETRLRPIHAHHGVIDGQRVAEHEQVAIATSHFTQDDYRLIRTLNVCFHAIYVLGAERARVVALVERGLSLTGVLMGALYANAWAPWQHVRQQFVNDLNAAIDGELCGAETEQPKLQPVFAGRLAREGWFGDAIEAVTATTS